MRRLLFCIFCAVIIVVASGSVVTQSSGKSESTPVSVKDQIIGAWRLAWLEVEGKDGKMSRTEHKGIIEYTPDGHMSVEIMLPTQETQPENGPVRYEQSGYEAYYGTYEVNERAHTVTHHVEGKLVRTLIGSDLTRVYRFSDKQLILRSSRADERWSIAWEHY